MIKNILVPVDGSANSNTALAYGIYMARKLDALLTGLHVIDVQLIQGPMMTDISGTVGMPPYEGFFDAIEKSLEDKVKQMITDPARIKKDDPGNPEICVVYSYHKIYNKEEQDNIGELCRKGMIGCVACKKNLAGKLIAMLEPIWKRREELAGNDKLLVEILEEGNAKARKIAEKTMEEVREVMGV